MSINELIDALKKAKEDYEQGGDTPVVIFDSLGFLDAITSGDIERLEKDDFYLTPEKVADKNNQVLILNGGRPFHLN